MAHPTATTTDATDDETTLPTEAEIEDVRDDLREGCIVTNEPTTEPDDAGRTYLVIKEIEPGNFLDSERRSDRVRYETLDGDVVGYTDDAGIAFRLMNGWEFAATFEGDEQ